MHCSAASWAQILRSASPPPTSSARPRRSTTWRPSLALRVNRARRRPSAGRGFTTLSTRLQQANVSGQGGGPFDGNWHPEWELGFVPPVSRWRGTSSHGARWPPRRRPATLDHRSRARWRLHPEALARWQGWLRRWRGGGRVAPRQPKFSAHAPAARGWGDPGARGVSGSDRLSPARPSSAGPYPYPYPSRPHAPSRHRPSFRQCRSPGHPDLRIEASPGSRL